MLFHNLIFFRCQFSWLTYDTLRYCKLSYITVSPETARAMAEGLAQVSGSDVCISVTGIAGPGGGTPEKPVGTVYMAVVYRDQTHVIQAPTVNVDRSYNRNHSVLSMLEWLNRLL